MKKINLDELKKLFKKSIKLNIINYKLETEEEIDEEINDLAENKKRYGELTSENIEEIRKEIKSEIAIRLDKGEYIEEEKHEKWFLEYKKDIDLQYWDRYMTYLVKDKDFSTSVVNELDDILEEQVDLLGNPNREISYSRKGLIIGDVQSGKTANYTGLICKAADAGYKVIILLTGTIEKLRRQTQQRLDEGFVGIDSAAIIKQKENGQIIGAGKYNKDIRPVVFTSTLDDFKMQVVRNLGLNLKVINAPVLFVLKKNVSILKTLNKWLKTSASSLNGKIDYPALIVDDEADNASVNTGNSNEEPTQINKNIREIIHSFTKSSYVGYTATPFANIFIDPDEEDIENQDLFPKDYIYFLKVPSNYIGARNIFKENGNYENMLMKIEEEEMEELMPSKHKKDDVIDCLPKDIKVAIETFLIANTIRDLRGHKETHRSMLINISRYTDYQNNFYYLVNDYLKKLQKACKIYSQLDMEECKNSKEMYRLCETYNNVYFDEIGIEWEKIQKEIYNSIGNIKVLKINQKSSHKLEYEEYSSGFRVIVIGGLTLSRGLTLEGLMISYLYRNTKMYDTLMQMGRWFGYRKGYEDLCKIWLTEESIEWYRHISEATDEMIEEIKSYGELGLTPRDFGIRVRCDINSLIVTARNKMRSAKSFSRNISLSENVLETPILFTSKNINQNNILIINNAIANLVKDGYKLESQHNNKLGFLNIPKEHVEDIISALNIPVQNFPFEKDSLLKFLVEYAGIELDYWDVHFPQGRSEEKIIISDNEIRYIERSYSLINDGKLFKVSGSKRRLGQITDAHFGITKDKINEIKKNKSTVIGEKKDPAQRDFFKKGVERRPLLCIYFVSPETNLEKEENNKIKNLEGPLVGISIGIPFLTDANTKYARYTMNKKMLEEIFSSETNLEDGDE